jgi:glycosyl transferase family 25
MKNFVINLNRQPDKYENFIKRNAGAEIPFERFEASDGALFGSKEVLTMRLVAFGARFTKGAVGCAASHFRIWKRLVEEGVPALVFEDDATLRHDISDRLESLLPTLEDWDFLTLGYNVDSILDVELAQGMKSMMVFRPQHPNDESDAIFQKSNPPVAAFRLNNCFGTPGYAISPAGAKKLLQLCFPMDNRQFAVPALNGSLLVEGVDGMMNGIYKFIKAYACFAPLVIPRNDHATSTVQTANAQAWM